MVKIDVSCSLEAFRSFIIASCCQSFIPQEFLENRSFFPERPSELGAVYVEAGDKITITKIEDISFVQAANVIGVVYNSKSGSTKLRWERTLGSSGRLTGESSMRSVIRLVETGVIRESDLRRPRKEKVSLRP